MVGQAGLFAWLALYSGIDRLSGGELDWLLNAADRWETFARQAAKLAPPATVFHGHDLSGIGAAIRSRDRHGEGAIVYDVHDLYVESGVLARSSRVLKFILRRREAAAWHRADAVLTVNASLAAELQRRYGERDVALVHNCVAVTPPGGRHPLRTALSLTSADRVALYQGALTEVRGLRQLAAAMDEPGLEKVHLAFMGFGPMLDELQWLSTAHPRIHVLPPVTHDDLDAWIASADVCVMPNQPAGINERLSTPNKLFESIAAGVPVVTSDFPERRAIVLDPDLGPLGAVCEPTRPASIAAAMRAVLDLDAEAATAMRARCRAAASVRWNWSEQERTLLETYQRVAGRPDGSDEHAPRRSMRAA